MIAFVAGALTWTLLPVSAHAEPFSCTTVTQRTLDQIVFTLEEPWLDHVAPRAVRLEPGEMPGETTAVDLAAEGIRTVIWSTGYRQDFSWIRVAGVLAPNGAPYGPEGPSPVRGIYFVGLHRQWESATGTLLGAGWRATPVAETIATRMRGS